MKKLSGFLILTLFLFFMQYRRQHESIELASSQQLAVEFDDGKSTRSAKFVSGLPFLNFQEGGKLPGFAGCNNFNGNFNLEGTALKLDPGAMTRKACPGEGEKDFTSELSQVANFKIKKDKLTLLDGAAKELMSFIPQAKT